MATPRYTFDIEARVNGQVGKATIIVLDAQNNVIETDRADLMDPRELKKVSKRMAPKLGETPETIQERLQAAWNERLTKHHRDQEEARTAAPCSPCSPCSLYVIEGGRICRMKHTPDGEPYTEPLCNFQAKVVREEILDDGSGETRTTFSLTGMLDTREPLRLVTVPAGDFSAMAWPIKEWGLRAIVHAGMGTKDNLRVAIQQMSQGAEKAHIYKHTGWRKQGEDWLYLHGGGAIGPAGSIGALRVELDGKLDHYRFPEPPSGEALTAAVRADLRLLDLAKPRLTYALLGAVYRAVLGQVDFSLCLVGKTGLGKSELSALAQQHYGAGLNRLNLPGNWTSTANALEGLAFLAKDALLTIDDFKPGGSKGEIDQWHSKAERVLRAQGNASGRQRCRPDGTLRADRPPRGLILISGEDLPRGESLRARLFTLQVRPGDFSVKDLTPYQQEAASGLYAQALSGFLHWLAPQYSTVQARLPQEHAALRDRVLATQNHPRTPGIVAALALGLKYLFDFAVDVGAVDPWDRDTLEQRGLEALKEAAADQDREIAGQDPARRFLRLVAAVITSGAGHLASFLGGVPDNPCSWGWSEETVRTGGGLEVDWRPRGKLIGWVEGENIYLDPEVAYAEAQRLAETQGDRIPVSRQQLQKQLKDGKLLASFEKDKTTARRTPHGETRPRAVLHLPAGYLSLPEQGEQGE
jgi:hypothetical protein